MEPARPFRFSHPKVNVDSAAGPGGQTANHAGKMCPRSIIKLTYSLESLYRTAVPLVPLNNIELLRLTNAPMQASFRRVRRKLILSQDFRFAILVSIDCTSNRPIRAVDLILSIPNDSGAHGPMSCV
jgi:hypothetical protein